MPLTIDDVTRSDEDPFSALSSILRTYNEKHLGPAEHVPLWLFARDEQGRVKAGLRGWTVWSWAYVDTLAVAEDCRRTGIGTSLLQRAEAVARERNCIGIYLWTVSFQAPEFYKRQGFTEFGRLDGLPPGHSAHWMMKRFT